MSEKQPEWAVDMEARLQKQFEKLVEVHNLNTDALIKGMDALHAQLEALQARLIRAEFKLSQ